MVDAATRDLVRRRAHQRCEYCRVHQDDFGFFTFHVDHIVPKQHGGGDGPENLCLACPECNAAKGTNLTGMLGGRIVPLFHPRRQDWKRHFGWRGAMITGKTQIGKVTVQVLNMNQLSRVLVRESLRNEGRLPPLEA